MIAWHLLGAGQLGLTLLGALPQRPLPTSLSQRAALLSSFFSQDLPFTRPQETCLSLPTCPCFTEELLLQHFSHLLFFL